MLRVFDVVFEVKIRVERVVESLLRVIVKIHPILLHVVNWSMAPKRMDAFALVLTLLRVLSTPVLRLAHWLRIAVLACAYQRVAFRIRGAA